MCPRGIFPDRTCVPCIGRWILTSLPPGKSFLSYLPTGHEDILPCLVLEAFTKA